MRKRKQNINFHEKVIGFCLLMFSVTCIASLSARLFADGFEYQFLERLRSIAICLTQTFGLFSYLLSLMTCIWGVAFLNGRIHDIGYKKTVFFTFIFLGALVFNILSTYGIISSYIKTLSLDYYTGGFIGYIVSKIMFIDICRNSTYNEWIFYGFAIIWVFVAKIALFLNLDIINVGAIQNFFKTALNKFSKSTIIEDVWEDAESINTTYKPKQEDSQTDFNVEQFKRFDNNGEYRLPYIDLLDKYSEKEYKYDEGKIATLSAELINVLEEFGVSGEILNVRQGPVVTMFEFRPAPGIKTSRVISLSDDIARSMSAISARISIIPGQNAIGIELPNKARQTVFLRELLASENFSNMNTGIPLILGKDISGKPIMADLAKMPHLLVAGTTGSGKSVSVNDMILSILFKFSPEDCKLIMIDPKMLELSVYDEIPHLLTPVVTDPKKAVFALKWAVAEMESRYRQMSKLGVRNIDGFNKKLKESKSNGELMVRKVQTGFDQETGRPIFETQQLEFEPMPYIVIIVDEMADLMLVAGKDVEAAIQRLAQMARAAGIHLIMATQRPSVDVITGTIKANFPTRISFQVTSKIDSRTILGEQGAEQLLGQGDMLYMSGAGRILRVHGPFVKDIEVERIVSFVKSQGEPNYVDVVSDQFGDSLSESGDSGSGDDMYKKALEVVMNDRKCSISYIQRKLQIGYNRAARIVEEMEQKGVLSAPNNTGKREILI
ncbi:MAG: hypothetical protein IJ481_00185 [Alphaproteobacteria bacterium]|nr:hypothetical protein [Alphaproteobacteria bacterium]